MTFFEQVLASAIGFTISAFIVKGIERLCNKSKR